jgi:hypothetical protein
LHDQVEIGQRQIPDLFHGPSGAERDLDDYASPFRVTTSFAHCIISEMLRSRT